MKEGDEFLLKLSMTDLLAGYRRHEFSPVDIVQELLMEAKKKNKKFNAFITINDSQAMKTAKLLEKKMCDSSNIQDFLEYPYLTKII